MKRAIFIVWSLVVLMGLSVTLYAQDEPEQEAETETETETDASSADFGVEAAFGVTSFTNSETGEVETYQLLALRPELTLGRFGVGLNLPFNYRFTGGEDRDEFEVREEDWVPDDDTSFLELYLPKFRYVRYGQKGDDIYAQVGNLPGATLGNGFIVSSYTNELFLPDRRISGAVFDFDRALAGQRYFGMETMVSNLAAWDLLAGRLYVRPLAGTAIPLLPELQIGVTVAADRDPYYFAERDPDSDFYQDAPSVESVLVWGLDVRQPILSRPVMSLAAYGDLVFQDDRMGGMVGAGGRLLGFLIYGAQIRVTEDNFIPEYFDRTYDRRRLDRLARYNEEVEVDGGAGWWTRIGFSLLNDAVVFTNTISGPFALDSSAYPELQSQLAIAEGVVPGFSGLSASASYTKFDIRGWDELTTAEDAIIGAQLNIRSGPVVISLVYDLVYDPELADEGADPWVVSSGLETAITF
ncbi:MAG: hypothetical protein ACOCU4_00430 [Alkalispirochaeta sp.]